MKRGKTNIIIIRHFSGALPYAFGNPPPSRSVEHSGCPPYNQLHIITLFRQHLVSLLILSSKMSILKREHTLQETNMEINRRIYIHY